MQFQQAGIRYTTEATFDILPEQFVGMVISRKRHEKFDVLNVLTQKNCGKWLNDVIIGQTIYRLGFEPLVILNLTMLMSLYTVTK